MNIIQQKWRFFHTIAPLAPKQISKLFQFGLKVLTLQPIRSLRANARLSNLKWYTAKTKMYRLMKNRKIPDIFLSILIKLHVTGRKDIVVVDFSDFGNGFQVLLFGKQTKKGRAVPLYFEILRYPIERNSQNTFIIKAIKRFVSLVGFKPTLVFDRGFACPSIIRFLASNQYRFLVRVKKGKSVISQETKEKFLAKDSLKDDLNVIAYNKELRLIVSDRPNGVKESWYIITNDFNSLREKIIKIYYHRFEIEELFRDTKRLLGLEYINFQKELTLATTLWFSILTMWFFWGIEKMLTKNDQRSRKIMELSIIRYCLENLQKEILHIAESHFVPVYSFSMAYEKV